MSHYPISKYVKFYPQGLEKRWVRAIIIGYQDSYDKLRVDLAEFVELHPNEFDLYTDRGDQAYASMRGLPVHANIPHMDLLEAEKETSEAFWCEHHETYNSCDYQKEDAKKDHFRIVDCDDRPVTETIFTSKQSAEKHCKRFAKIHSVCKVIHIQQNCVCIFGFENN